MSAPRRWSFAIATAADFYHRAADPDLDRRGAMTTLESTKEVLMSNSLSRIALTAAALAGSVALAAPRTARADARLTATVFTGSPAGFLVDSTLVAGDKDAI